MAKHELKQTINPLSSNKGKSTRCFFLEIVFVAIVLLVLGNGIHAKAQNITNVLVLVNSGSAGYLDFERYIRPYLDNFGIPYSVIDIASGELSSSISDYAAIVIGHRQLDPNHVYLGSNEENYISSAVNTGTGLVNFDNDLSATGGVPRYQFIQSIFGFSYAGLLADQGIAISAHDGLADYITARHEVGERIVTGNMSIAGLILPPQTEVLATTDGNYPFLSAVNYGQGRGVQWSSYDWMSHSIKGPLYGLDDLVWRSIIWAARKPFVMQGLPPFVTMRVDDEYGPFEWIHTANEFGLKPWTGLFYPYVSETDAADLSAFVNAGLATASVHAKGYTEFLYFNHRYGNFSDSQIAVNFLEATAWHQNHNIPISRFVLPHIYEFGTNVFNNLSQWGVEFVGTVIAPGNSYPTPWIQGKPYRQYEAGASDASNPLYYAHFLDIPSHPEMGGRFFNCITEIRDDAGYEWYPDNNVAESIGRGTRQAKRALDSLALATLFTHGQFLHNISSENLRAILNGITANLSSYNPLYVTMDYACQYIRAMYTSDISYADYDPDAGTLTVTLIGNTDMPTFFYAFTEQAGDIHQTQLNVPIFSNSTTVFCNLLSPLHHIVVSPSSIILAAGQQQQFTAQGYDINGAQIPGLQFSWAVVNGGGTIDTNGLFTAGTEQGVFQNTVVASSGGISGSASVSVGVAAPGAPTNLTATASPGQVALAWQASSGATSYIVRRSLTSGGPYTVIASGLTATIYTDTTVQNGTWYYYVVAAVNAGGESPNSNEASALPQVTPPTLDHFSFDSIMGTVVAGISFGVRITAYDQFGNAFASFAGQAVLSDTTGTILPTGTGSFVNGVWSGNVTIGQAADGVTITASSGTATGVSNTFNVVAEPQEIIINCWEDSHQSPILQTTTDAGALSPTDGSWTEFHFVSGRPFPAVFAGAEEENYGLPVMRFYATGIPNGRYEVLANLYTQYFGRDMRYYYGYTAGNPKAYSIDTVGGAGGSIQFQEYSLGIVNITNGNFNIYVRDADLLGGSYPYFGWAWIRLLPQSSSLASIAIAPSSTQVATGATRQFMATGYDANENPIPGLTFVWSAASGGTIDQNGLFTAGLTPGIYIGSVSASRDGITGYASVEVYVPILDHFSFDSIAGTIVVGTPFVVRITAYDQLGNVFAGYTGQAALSDTTGTISPPTTGSFANGVWSGNVTIAQATTGATITASSGTAIGMSNAFNVVAAPAAPTNLTATAGNGQVALAWQASSGATSYIVRRSLTSGGPYTAVVSGLTSTSYTDTSVQNGTRYYYVVVAVNEVGESPNSNEASALPQVAAPAAPTNLTATAGNGQVALAWQASSGATSYIVRRSLTSGGPYTAVVSGLTSTSYTDTSVQNGTRYYYVVAAVNAGGESPNSNEASALPQVAPPAAPTNLTATASPGQVALAWRASSGATSYTVKRSLTSGGPYTILASGLTATIYTDTTVQNGTWYYYVVAAVNAGGESPNSNEASALPQVTPPTLDHFSFDSIAGTIVAGTAFGVRITAYDQFGNVFGSFAGQAVLSDTTGTILPTATGSFVNGVWSGNVTIAQVANGVRITASSGTATGVSNTFNVVAAPQEIIINCWEDNHQQPVLSTTTDPGVLNPTDGAWTEFLYSAGRPYPGVFAGGNEENYGLPAMRFYATGIANGRYEVIANLYTNNPGRDMRYYYGYAVDNPKAYSVDALGTDSNSYQFQEYSLGIVDITDGNFNIYVRDADLLAGSYPYFGWAWVRLVPQSSALASIVVTPNSAQVATGATQQFAAIGYDADGSPIHSLTFTWSTASGGTIDQSGLFTAGLTPGIYSSSVSASRDGITGYASVEVYVPNLDHFSFDSIAGPIVAGTVFEVRITAYDQFGNVFGSFAGQAVLSDTTGTISPSTTGNFANGVWSGNVTIAQVASGVTITASSGTATGVSNTFNVVAALQEITINCWEDNHQSPILPTTTNAGDLNPTDGNWTEFQYVAGRPFPAVFAGTDEENYGLPVMRFYATGIANGRYEVIANLYTNNPGRDTRYYYGYAVDNPKAYSVDALGTDSNSYQFQEYILGIVDITDGNFNIYVRDADLLAGSYPYFGWAWIRLVRLI